MGEGDNRMNGQVKRIKCPDCLSFMTVTICKCDNKLSKGDNKQIDIYIGDGLKYIYEEKITYC